MYIIYLESKHGILLTLSNTGFFRLSLHGGGGGEGGKWSQTVTSQLFNRLKHNLAR